MIGLSTSGSISLGCAFVAGRNRVPRPAAGKTALRTFAADIASYLAHSGCHCASPESAGEYLQALRDADSIRMGRVVRWFFPDNMAYVIAEPCIGTKDTACVDACPV